MSIKERLNPITHIPQNYLSPTPPPPKSVKIELSPRCNYKCKYCGYSFRWSRRNDMPFDLFAKITKEMKEIGVEEIGVFYIGESFINGKLLTRAINYLKKDLNIPYVFLTSNASLASPQLVKECMSLGLDSLKWSCNASDEKQFEEMMGVPSVFFGMAKDNIKLAYKIRNEEGYKTKLYASSIKYDEAQVEKMHDVLYSEILPYVDEHYWLPLYTMGGVSTESSKSSGYQPVAGNPGRCDSLVEPLPCWTLFTAGHVLSDGRMTACCMDATGSWVMGDLKTQSFMECWHSEEFQKLRKEHIKKNVIGTKCEKCALVS